MKNYFLYIFLFLFFIGCSKKEVKKENIVVRNDIAYEVNSETPFTGIQIDEYEHSLFDESKFKKLSEIKDNDYKPGYKSKIEYSNGKPDGLQIEWWNNGQRRTEAKCKNGKFDGKLLYYYENGQIQYDYIYKNGQPDGVCKSYHNNGQLQSVNEFREGKIWNILQDYFENGQKVEGHTLKDGNGIVIITEGNRIIRSERVENGLVQK